MGKIGTLFVFLILAGCAGGSSVRRGADQLGWVDRSVFDDPRYPEYRAAYDTTQIAPDFTGMVAAVHEGSEVLVFFGIWCSDSKRELPRFLKLADLSGIPSGRIRLYALDRKKQSPDGLETQYGIERVPTFIFLRDGAESGRIVERPRSSLEADVLTILASRPPGF